LGDELAAAITTCLALALDKAADYNCLLATWESTRGIVKHLFQRHDFGMKWTYGEFDGAHNLFPWATAQVGDAVGGIVDLLDVEAGYNPSRFVDMGRKKKELAAQDYERKMEACFREAHRLLKDDGVLTVMFTHKKVEAWDTLGAALINAGFAVHSSWPVHTES